MRDDDFEPLVTPHLTTMLRVARVMVGDLRDRDAVRAWLLRITVNACHNWRRSRNIPTGRYTLPLENAPAQSVGAREGDPGASDHALRLDIRQAIADLDPELQQLIALRYFAGLDSTELGAMLGAPPATVRTRLRRALALLRQRLDGPDWRLAAPAREKGNLDV
jgi:RNA polymerase sigma-70 factor (ECF subfamily)